jgi:pyruvate-formate lyase-activating enzyme
LIFSLKDFSVKKRVLVVNPYITDFKLYDEWMHPVGLYFLIDLLKRNGIETEYFNCLERSPKLKKYGCGDFLNREIPKPLLYKSINRKYKLYGCEPRTLEIFIENMEKPDLVCVGSMMTYWAPGVIETVKIIRSKLENVPVVIGGIAAQLMPHYFRKLQPGIFTAGPIHLLCEWGKDIPVLGKLKSVGELSLLGGLESLRSTYHGPLLTSLGCPMKCSYCASSLLQPRYCKRPLETILKETALLHERFGTVDYAFYDDALLLNPDNHLIPLLKKFCEKGIRLRFHTPNGLHISLINEKILNILKNAGFTTLRFGYESGSKKYYNQTGKKASIYDLTKLAEMLRTAGFDAKDCGVYVMGGLPDQLPEEMVEEMEFAASTGLSVKPVFVSPVPGTALFKKYLSRYPLLEYDPLWHNDTYFISCLDGWNEKEIEQIRQTARKLNSKLQNIESLTQKI